MLTVEKLLQLRPEMVYNMCKFQDDKQDIEFCIPKPCLYPYQRHSKIHESFHPLHWVICFLLTLLISKFHFFKLISGEKSVMTSSHLKRYYCGDKKPFTLSTRYYELELKFSTSGYRRSNRGFIIGYIAYKSKGT